MSLSTPKAVLLRGQDVVAHIVHADQTFAVSVPVVGCIGFERILGLGFQAVQHRIRQQYGRGNVLIQAAYRKGFLGFFRNGTIFLDTIAEILPVAADSQGHGVAVAQILRGIQRVVQAASRFGGGQAVHGGRAPGRGAVELYRNTIERIKGVYLFQPGDRVGNIAVLHLDTKERLRFVLALVPTVSDDITVAQTAGLVGTAVAQ